jgi:hypothetical protein
LPCCGFHSSDPLVNVRPKIRQHAPDSPDMRTGGGICLMAKNTERPFHFLWTADTRKRHVCVQTAEC